MPDGSVMTETAAIALHVDELVPAAGLFPAPGDPLRRDALRWLMFLIAAVYPTFTYGDEPEKWIGDAGPRLARRDPRATARSCGGRSRPPRAGHGSSARGSRCSTSTWRR